MVDLFAEFLFNIKVADYTIPGTAVEKISEMMEKLREDCLRPFGLIVSQKKLVILILLNTIPTRRFQTLSNVLFLRT